MKHVTLLADADGTYSEPDGGWRIEVDGHVFYLHNRHVVSVKDAPLPLPTEPGARFWGKAKNVPPQWWFVTRALDCRNETIDYVCSDGHRFAASLMDDEATRVTRLPDPEVQP